MRYPTAAEWNGKEKSCSVPTAAYPPAIDTIMFRVWRTHSVLLTARGHMVRSRPQTVSPRVVHASHATRECSELRKISPPRRSKRGGEVERTSAKSNINLCLEKKEEERLKSTWDLLTVGEIY